MEPMKDNKKYIVTFTGTMSYTVYAQTAEEAGYEAQDLAEYDGMGWLDFEVKEAK